MPSGDHSERLDACGGRRRRVRFFSGTSSLCLGVALILLSASTATIAVSGPSDPSKGVRIAEAKRFARSSVDLARNDVEIVPENQEGRRGSVHGNHRYVAMEPEGSIYKKIMKDLYEESGWSPKPFHVGTEGLSGVESMLENGGRPPVRLRGVYIRSQMEEEEEAEGEDHHYPREINHLMQNDHDGDAEEGNWSSRKVFRGGGSPFRLPGKERSHRHHARQSDWNGRRRSKKNPITILLGIYPTTDLEEGPRGGRPAPGGGSRGSDNYNPMFGESTKVVKFLRPPDGRRGMILKLNLYPKTKRSLERRTPRGRHRRRPATRPHPHLKPIRGTRRAA